MSSLEVIKIKKAVLTPEQNTSSNSTTIDAAGGGEENGIRIERAITSVDFFSDILSPSVTCYIKINNTFNLYNSAPLRGNERLDLQIGTTYGDFEYTEEKPFYVVAITDLIQKEGSETFTMQCATLESINNETARCVKRYKREPVHLHVESILSDVLKVKRDRIIEIEPTSFPFEFIGNMKKPFYTCTWLCPKGVPASQGPKGTSGDSTEGVAYGTAGYFFYEDYDGFHFRSMEKMLDAVANGAEDGDVPVYVSSSVAEREATDKQIIHSFMSANTHVQKNLRIGLYSNLTYFFEPMDWKLGVYHYKMKDNFDTNDESEGIVKSMKKSPDNKPKNKTLGERLPIPTELGDYASRVLVRLGSKGNIDNSLIVDDDQELGDDGRDHADMAKAFSRYNMLFQQSLNIVIPINTNLRVGGIIKVVLPTVGPTQVGDSKPADNESSGYYLIRCLRHHFEISGGTNITSLNLVRDSYGLK